MQQDNKIKDIVEVKKRCLVCKYFYEYLCEHPSVYAERRVVGDSFKTPDWCPGFEINERIITRRNRDDLYDTTSTNPGL